MALRFVSASTDRVNFGSNVSLDNVNTVTLLMWVNFVSYPTGDGGGLWDKAKADYTNARQWFVLTGAQAGRMGFEVSRATTIASAYSLNGLVTTGLNFLGASWDGVNVPKLYRGTPTTLAAEPSYTSQNAGSGAISDDSANNMLVGNLVDLIQGLGGNIVTFQMFNTQLSLPQIQRQQFNPRVGNSCVLFSMLGVNGTGIQIDQSGHNNHGLVTGAQAVSNEPLRFYNNQQPAVLKKYFFGRRSPSGTISTNLLIPTSAMSGAAAHIGTIAANLPKPISAASGIVEHLGALAANLPKPTMSASGQKVETGTIATNLPIPTASMSGTVGVSGATGTINTNLLLPTAAMAGIAEHLGTFSANLPKPTGAMAGIVEHYGQMASTLPKPAAAFTGTTAHLGTMAVSLPVLTMLASGNLGHSGTIVTNLPKLVMAASGNLGHSGIMASNLPMIRAVMSGFVGLTAPPSGESRVQSGSEPCGWGSAITIGGI